MGAVINLLLVQCITEHLISTIETSDVAGEEWSWCAGVMVRGLPCPVTSCAERHKLVYTSQVPLMDHQLLSSMSWLKKDGNAGI